MQRKEKKTTKQVDEIRKKSSLKGMYFNRYLMIRYFFALFVFTNVYWGIATLGTMVCIVPFAMVVLAILPCYEMFKVYGKKRMKMTWSERFFKVQLMVNACLLIVCFTPGFGYVFPFLQVSLTTRSIMIGLLVLGGLLATACLKRFSKIQGNQDKQYIRIKQVEKSANVYM